jgi:hypothetical protein
MWSGGRDSLGTVAHVDDPEELQPLTDQELDERSGLVEAWLWRQLDANPVVAAVEKDPTGVRRWFLRVRGEEKDVFSIWFTLGQRTLHYETYVMPAPEENHAEFYEHLLRRNPKIYGAAFAIGAEDAVFLLGQFPAYALTELELDRILGTLYAATEQFFRPALRIGYASRFKG